MDINIKDIEKTEIKKVPEKYRSLKSKNVEIAYNALLKALDEKLENNRISKAQYDSLVSVVNEVYNERLISLLVEDNLNKFYNTVNINLYQALSDLIVKGGKDKNESVSFLYSKNRLRLVKYGK